MKKVDRKKYMREKNKAKDITASENGYHEREDRKEVKFDCTAADD